MITRLCQTALVAGVAFHLLLVLFNNLTDYPSNYRFVAHVLAMDTTFEGNRGMWRAVTHPAVHHVFYWVIILWEFVAGALCTLGAVRLWHARRADRVTFARAKPLATLGLTISLLQWFVAFLTVGGEWFLMWQSRTWNGQEAAFRMFACLALVLIFLHQREPETE